MAQAPEETSTPLPSAERPSDYKKAHTGVGFSMVLAFGLIALVVLMLLLALIMIGVSGPLGEP
ncbi:MAG: hypothetical protein NZ524_06975 [Thiobacillaceae bacterium]|nr:hypothetical protein [Thiobacillaceae bacterium]MCX7672961.1 hypothetical protein [Thiobacillaceae bacterium]MDW8324345.1 hypothetical protein [Burkholderiales bacterium]